MSEELTPTEISPELVDEKEEIQRLQFELRFKEELKMHAATILSGIKSNNSRSTTKDIDHVKESVRLALMLMNYVNILPLNFSEKPE